TQNHDLSSWPDVSNMLSGGLTTLDIVASAPRPAVFSGQTVRGATGTQLGGILVGDYLDDRAAAIKASLHDDVTYYDVSGQVLSTSSSVPPAEWSTLALDPTT